MSECLESATDFSKTDKKSEEDGELSEIEDSLSIALNLSKNLISKEPSLDFLISDMLKRSRESIDLSSIESIEFRSLIESLIEPKANLCNPFKTT